MNKFHSIVLGGALAFGLIGLAQADAAVTGAWKLTVGSADTCTLTLADTGSVTNSDCTNGGQAVGQWKQVGPKLELLSSRGELVAYLQPKDGAYEGKRVADGRVVALVR